MNERYTFSLRSASHMSEVSPLNMWRNGGMVNASVKALESTSDQRQWRGCGWKAGSCSCRYPSPRPNSYFFESLQRHDKSKHHSVRIWRIRGRGPEDGRCLSYGRGDADSRRCCVGGPSWPHDHATERTWEPDSQHSVASSTAWFSKCGSRWLTLRQRQLADRCPQRCPLGLLEGRQGRSQNKKVLRAVRPSPYMGGER